MAVQGHLDPLLLIAGGDPDGCDRVRELLDRVSKAGLIFSILDMAFGQRLRLRMLNGLSKSSAQGV